MTVQGSPQAPTLAISQGIRNLFNKVVRPWKQLEQHVWSTCTSDEFTIIASLTFMAIERQTQHVAGHWKNHYICSLDFNSMVYQMHDLNSDDYTCYNICLISNFTGNGINLRSPPQIFYCLVHQRINDILNIFEPQLRSSFPPPFPADRLQPFLDNLTQHARSIDQLTLAYLSTIDPGSFYQDGNDSKRIVAFSDPRKLRNQTQQLLPQIQSMSSLLLVVALPLFDRSSQPDTLVTRKGLVLPVRTTDHRGCFY